jgi:threonine/homoserine efflux transporter RhtA
MIGTLIDATFKARHMIDQLTQALVWLGLMVLLPGR